MGDEEGQIFILDSKIKNWFL